LNDSLMPPPSFDRPAIQVRRTKISERIRKLQELVPNMDKVLPALPRYALYCTHQQILLAAMRGPLQAELTYMLPVPCSKPTPPTCWTWRSTTSRISRSRSRYEQAS
jgi:hypothetical protein